MNSAITKGIAILLLIVAARDVEGKRRLVGALKVRDGKGGGRIGEINFWQSDVLDKRIDMHVDIPNIPVGNYTAIVHRRRCYPSLRCKIGPVLPDPSEVNNFKTLREPLILFRASSTPQYIGIFATVAVDEPLQSYLKNEGGFYIVIYKDEPGLKIYARSRVQKLRYVGFTYVTNELIAPGPLYKRGSNDV